MANDIKYIQLEPAAFLTDIDFQMMDSEQRGVYCSIIFYLYCNNGKIELSDGQAITLLSGKTSILAQISGCLKIGKEWDAIWGKIADKFQINGNILTHKRVTEELKRVVEYRKGKSEAGKKGMAKRWADNTDITKVSKGKVSKGKKTVKHFVPPTLDDVKKYVADNPELSNVDPTNFWKSFNDGDWIDTRGNPVRNWKLKLRTWSNYGQSSKSKQAGSQTAGQTGSNQDRGPAEFIR